MARLEIRPTQPRDAELLGAEMRASDAAEVRACGREPLESARRGVAQSMFCWSAFEGEQLVCIFGCAPLSVVGGIGSPWMLGTPLLRRHERVLVRVTPRYIGTMLKAFPHLVNYVHTDNATSVRWLKRLGFTLQEAAPFGALGEAFHRFEMKV